MTGSALPQVVVSAVAPLWHDSAAPDRIGEPGVGYPDYRMWVDRLLTTRAPLNGALDTVAICGEPVRVLGAAAGSLLRVELPAQPNGATGYVGYMDARHVGVDARGAVTHVIGPSGSPAGTTVQLLGESADGDVDVRLPSGQSVTCAGADLHPVRPRESGDPLAIAFGFVGSPYVWGGLEGAGIDCSGLVHTASRIAGRIVPRDAHQQWATLRVDIEWAQVRPGDLLFFGDHAGLDGIDHVGFYLGDERLLHAPETGRAVVVEPISIRGRNRVVAFGRF